MKRRYLVTGGGGFIGAAIVRRLVEAGAPVRVLDNGFRGDASRLRDVADRLEWVAADVRDGAAVADAAQGVDSVIHLAYVNGTEHFYAQPDLVLEVGVKGMGNVLDACRAAGVRELVVASSSEVYQTPSVVPTPETVPLVVPDPHNPRYSYGGGKILCELMTIHGTRSGFERAMIFRPHNVYGPDMGREHVLPQLVLRLKGLIDAQPTGPIRLPIQGTGAETRAFVEIADFVDGFMAMLERGEHHEIYNIGTDAEIAIRDVVAMIGAHFGRDVMPVQGAAPAGGTLRRCPDISKLRRLGYAPKVSLRDGIARLSDWYVRNADESGSSR